MSADFACVVTKTKEAPCDESDIERLNFAMRPFVFTLTSLLLAVLVTAAVVYNRPRETHVLSADFVPFQPPQIESLSRDRPDAARASDISTRYVPLELLRSIANRFVPKKSYPNADLHVLLHALRLWGSTATFAGSENSSGNQMLEVLLNVHAYSHYFPGAEPLVYESPYGLGVRYGSTPDSATHLDKMLSVLGECNVPLDETIQLSHRTASVEEVLSDSVSRFQLDQVEIEWTAIAFAAYIAPTNRSWSNRFHQQFTFDDLVVELMRRDFGRQTCYGTHLLYALTYILAADDKYHVLTFRHRSKVLRHLAQVSKTLELGQYETGCWGPFWYLDGADIKNDQNPPQLDLKNLVRSTGHHLEWISIAPESVRPSPLVIEAASQYVARVMASVNDADFKDGYCPYSHAFPALCVLEGVNPTDLLTRNAGTAPDML